MASTFTPAGPLPSDDASHANLDAEFIATIVLVMSTTTVFTFARLVGRRAMGKFAAEDYLSFATWVVFMGYSAAGILQMKAGIGHHIWDISESKAPEISKLSWAIELIYCVVTWLAKAALLLQLQRIFCPTGSGFIYRVCQSLIWGNLAFYISAFVAVACECIPIQRAWDQNVHGSCIDIGALLLFMAGLNVFSDVLILLVPIWAIVRLRIGFKFKLDVWAFFAPYLFAIAASVCKLVYTVPPVKGGDTTYTFAPVELWSLAELAAIILCTCFPLMPRFMQVVRETSSSLKSRFHESRSIHELQSEEIKVPPNFGDNCADCSRIGHFKPEDWSDVESGSKDDDEQRLYIHTQRTVTVSSNHPR